MLFRSAFRDAFGEPEKRPGAWSAKGVLAALKVVEVALESLPEIVLQFMLLVDTGDWGSQLLRISLPISIAAAAILVADAESSFNADRYARRAYAHYYGYLPMQGMRRHLLLGLTILFLGSYLVLSALTLAVGLKLLPAVTAVVISADCALHHVLRALEGEWWITGDATRSGVVAWILDLIVNTVL